MWIDRALPDLTRLFNPGRLQSAFSRQAFIDLGLAAAKVLALAWAAWSTLRADFLTLPKLLSSSAAEQLTGTLGMTLRAGGRMLLVALVLAGVDVAITRWRFMKNMRVSRQEAKRESREEEGDPLIKGKRRSRHRELSRGRARVEVPRADALLVNPTHVAVALRYRRDEGRAPRVIAKGKGALAEYMRDLARENAVPIVQDIPLARLLYRKVKVGREIPAATYKAVAAVLAFVYRLTGRQPGGSGVSP
jgi:flagellar biosynthesis protein FlhB